MNLADALFTRSQQLVFLPLFGQAERSFHLSELLRLTGLGSASLQRELRRLVDAGLITSRNVGNQRHFQANPQSPLYPELLVLTEKTMGLVPLLVAALDPLRPDLKAAWIYGSVAKQTAHVNSDVDLLLVGENLTLGQVLERVLPVEARTGRKINPNCMSESEFFKRKCDTGSFVHRILSQPMVTLIEPSHPDASTRQFGEDRTTQN
jgi:predicted nucleotidyltransferase